MHEQEPPFLHASITSANMVVTSSGKLQLGGKTNILKGDDRNPFCMFIPELVDEQCPKGIETDAEAVGILLYDMIISKGPPNTGVDH